MASNDDPLESIHDVLAFSSRDWSESADLAWIYGIICGWDADPNDPVNAGEKGAMQALAKKFNWTQSQVDRLRRLHTRMNHLRKDKRDA